MKSLDEYLELAERAHGHMCAGQVLGVRLAMLGVRELGLDPVKDSAKQKAREMFPELDKEQGQQKAYRVMPDEEMFEKQWVRVAVRPEDLPGFKGPRVACAECGEGINFKREVLKEGRTLCRACAGERYYEPLS
ncbi:MAG: TraR/DksA C4-type zinc finger protein [Acidobacteria bacterium]|nr:TraR/DksA C4-type zinc finger protein [Acidobacteriota bacterium]